MSSYRRFVGDVTEYIGLSLDCMSDIASATQNSGFRPETS